ncbi:hypothetical protein F1654_07795 [Alkalicaulis satelles]|uniref:Uncharacterized protein n=1 Tax=Alkalicaulis satelles TaxID=2609175 RepID=A0A5M6ZHX7_9PROT|nr:hypothetical protein [Alkalicaulis satelles]KAA5803695.1 hypothetical protein F1654_07795 [Alkalicaulis satelles]
MKRFTVRKRVDAYANYVATVVAPDEDTAADIASDHEYLFEWDFEGLSEFDDRHFVTIENDGTEIDSSSTR